MTGGEGRCLRLGPADRVAGPADLRLKGCSQRSAPATGLSHQGQALLSLHLLLPCTAPHPPTLSSSLQEVVSSTPPASDAAKHTRLPHIDFGKCREREARAVAVSPLLGCMITCLAGGEHVLICTFHPSTWGP